MKPEQNEIVEASLLGVTGGLPNRPQVDISGSLYRQFRQPVLIFSNFFSLMKRKVNFLELFD